MTFKSSGLMIKRSLKSVFALAFILAFISQSSAQTSGFIFKSAGTGSTVLDPNGDGFTSTTTSGFLGDDVSNSEIPYKAIPQFNNEPNSDLATGPNCGYSDFIDYANSNEQVVGMYIDASNNFLFRFRLSGTADNSKGYSILVDADQKFGASGVNADPNYTPANPGFEFEIVLRSNFEVTLYDVDGTSTPVKKDFVPSPPVRRSR
jgi:large repetitive protein